MFSPQTIDQLGGVPTRDRQLRARGRTTVEKLVRAAGRALREHGHRTLRVDDVVALAGVSHGTFYLYYQDTDDVLRALVRLSSVELAGLGEQLGDSDRHDDPEAVLVDWCKHAADACDERREVLRAAAALGLDGAAEALRGPLEAWLARNPAADERTAANAANLLVLALVDGALHERDLDTAALGVTLLRYVDG